MKRVWTGATFAMMLGCAVALSAQAGSTTSSQTAAGRRTITVTGCLSGGSASGTTGATGTSGTAGSTASTSRMGGSPYTLTNARMGSGNSGSTSGASTSGSGTAGTASGAGSTGSAPGGANTTTGTAGSGSSSSAAMSGSTYVLEGHDTELSQHRGHQVEVTGMLASASAPAGSGSTGAGSTTPGSTSSGNTAASGDSSAMSAGQHLQVSSVRMIASTCAQ